MSTKLIPQNNIPIYWVTISGLRGKGILSLILAPFKLIMAMAQAAVILMKIKNY